MNKKPCKKSIHKDCTGYKLKNGVKYCLAYEANVKDITNNCGR